MKLIPLVLFSFALASVACSKQVDMTVTNADGTSTTVSITDSHDHEAHANEAQLPASRSDLQVENHDMDLGKVFQQQTYEVEFPFVVNGPDPILISEIDSSCGCTKPGIRPDWDPDFEGEFWPLNREIPAGAKGAIVATFDAQRYERVKASTITVRGNFMSKKVVVNVTAYVQPVFELMPRNITFGELHISQLGNAEVRREIKVTGMQEFEIVRWRKVTPGIEVEEIGEAVKLDDGRMERNFKVTASSVLPEGRLASSLIAETTLGVDLELLMNGNVLGAIKFAPQRRIAFGIFDQGNSRTRTVKMESMGIEIPEPQVEVIGDAAKVMTPVVNATQAGKLYEIKISIGDTAPAGSYNGILRISFPEASGLQKKEIVLNARIR
ncbi:MAG: DUF1573 domain-containing protein [Planctomycetes bacterium]|nr:DUF1573 domain-containing protein [Planctomycetota bacterium]MCP4772498.1 DUF1573 domain-containing protein [Planctomycetota bacterium]MCP4860907.1 DUF1573 domain-containing protein [Planctomycetota bacterium]